MASSSSQQLETGHQEMIHDAQLDFYGRRLATCSSDRSIKVFDISESNQTQIAELRGHHGPVWQVQWAHPKYNSVLASCSFDRSVILWREVSPSQFIEARKIQHELSINSISWAPHEFGLVLAAASSDGYVSVVTLNVADLSINSQQKVSAHNGGVNSVSWAPAVPSFQAGQPVAPEKRFVTGGCDNSAHVWKLSEMAGWTKQSTLSGHQDWVRDVAWAPNIASASGTIATCSQDKTVRIWVESGGQWSSKVVSFESVPWRLSWSITGSILAVSCDDNKVTLLREGLDGEWETISQVDEQSAADAAAAPQ